MNEAEDRALSRAAEQYGLISRQQAIDCRMTARQVDTRIASARWAVVHPSVYRVRGAPVTIQRIAIALQRAVA